MTLRRRVTLRRRRAKGPGRHRLLAAGILASALATAGCSGAPSEDDCIKLRAHLVDLEAAASGETTAGTAANKADLEAQKKKVLQSIKLDFCTENLSKDQVACGLKARSLEALAATCDN